MVVAILFRFILFLAVVGVTLWGAYVLLFRWVAPLFQARNRVADRKHKAWTGLWKKVK